MNLKVYMNRYSQKKKNDFHNMVRFPMKQDIIEAEFDFIIWFIDRMV